MRRSTYRQVAAAVTLPVSAWPHTELIAERFDVTVEAVVSIYSQLGQQRVTANFHRLKAAGTATLARYRAGRRAVELAFELDFPPALIARQLLQDLLCLSKQQVTEAVRNPQLLLQWRRAAIAAAPAAAAAAQQSGTQASSAQPSAHRAHMPPATNALAPSLSDDSSSKGSVDGWPSEVEVARLAEEVAVCVDADCLYSPSTDAVRHMSGLEAEARLCSALNASGVPFWSEEALRESGFIKTPDVRLQVPVLCRGVVVHWIDSKATFGDETTHQTQVKEQYSRYVNRYGSGAVVYWGGFVPQEGRPGLPAARGIALLHDVPALDPLTRLPLR